MAEEVKEPDVEKANKGVTVEREKLENFHSLIGHEKGLRRFCSGCSQLQHSFPHLY